MRKKLQMLCLGLLLIGGLMISCRTDTMLENNESASLRSKLVSKSISLQESIHRTKLIPLLEDT